MSYRDVDESVEEKKNLFFKISLGVLAVGVILIISGVSMKKSIPDIIESNVVEDVSNPGVNDPENPNSNDFGAKDVNEGAIDPNDLSDSVSFEEISLSDMDVTFRNEFYPLIVSIYNQPNEDDAMPFIDDMKAKFGDDIAETVRTSVFSQISKSSVYEEVYTPVLLFKGPLVVSEPVEYLSYTLIVPARQKAPLGLDDPSFATTQNVYYNFNYYPDNHLINDISVRALDGEVFKDE